MTVVFDIGNAIVTKLQGVGFLNGVFFSEVPAPSQGTYPFATVVVRRGTGVFGDTIRNKRVLGYEINVYQERTKTGQGPAAAETISVHAIDEILTAFDADTTLSGLVSFVKPLDFDAAYINREIGDTRILKFDVEATVLVPSTT